MANIKKRKYRKEVTSLVWTQKATKNLYWSITFGKLIPSAGRPNLDDPIFEVIGEKLPFASLKKVNEFLKSKKIKRQGVYIAHDSMGTPRYIGRGNIFSRLNKRKKKYPLELMYYSFYVVKKKNHEREVETVLIRATSQSLFFNEKKKRIDLSAGNVKDYEPSTYFFQRKRTKNRKKK